MRPRPNPGRMANGAANEADALLNLFLREVLDLLTLLHLMLLLLQVHAQPIQMQLA